MTRLCECGCGQPTRLEKNRFLHGHQVGRGPTHMNWVGGKSTAHRGGYVQITAGTREPILEHIAVAERALGNPLPQGARVHHVDQDRTNNAGTNLVICQDHAYHMLLHKRQRALEACGDANAHRCVFCHGYEHQEDMTVCRLRDGGIHAYHRACNAKSRRDYTARHRARIQEVRP